MNVVNAKGNVCCYPERECMLSTPKRIYCQSKRVLGGSSIHVVMYQLLHKTICLKQEKPTGMIKCITLINSRENY